MTLILFTAGVLLGGFWLVGLARRRRRRHQAMCLAEDLLPEIRSILSSADPNGASDGEPVAPRRFESHRQLLAGALPREPLFAVETFYQSAEAYREARRAMQEAFTDESKLSVGDRIRAKDRRDRALKDVYYSGEAAIQSLERLADRR